MIDRDTLKRLQERNPEAVAAAVRAYAGDLLRGALGLGLSETDAEELVQDTFAALLEGAARFEGRSTLKTYLFGILYRKALEHRRLKSREAATDPADGLFEERFSAFGHWNRPPQGPEQEADTREIAELIAACLEGLAPQQRAVFHLKEVLHETAEDICNVLSVSDTNLRVLLFRARSRLRGCIEAKWRPSTR